MSNEGTTHEDFNPFVHWCQTNLPDDDGFRIIFRNFAGRKVEKAKEPKPMSSIMKIVPLIACLSFAAANLAASAKSDTLVFTWQSRPHPTNSNWSSPSRTADSPSTLPYCPMPTRRFPQKAETSAGWVCTSSGSSWTPSTTNTSLERTSWQLGKREPPYDSTCRRRTIK